MIGEVASISGRAGWAERLPVVLAQNSIWRNRGQRQHRAASPILRGSTLIAMMQATDLREGNNVIALEG